ncbi:MAG: hypothetical protein DCC64_04435 [Planctomycetota bacterium]|nr:MAG: hypothetical protein DCC64_04435 [Planctomycetota bacterium]
MSRVPPPQDDDAPHEGQVFEEEDEDLDLSLDDVAPLAETVEQRLLRAAERSRRSAPSLAERMRQAAERGKGKAHHEGDSQVHEVVEEEDESLGDISLDGDGGHEVVEEHDEDVGDISLDDVAAQAGPEEFNPDAQASEVGEIQEGWDDTEAIERAKLEQMRGEAGPATVADMKLDAMGLPPAPDMQAGPMTMAIHEAGQNLTLGPISDTDRGEDVASEDSAPLATGATDSKLVDSKPFETIGEVPAQAEAELESSDSDSLTSGEERAGSTTFGTGALNSGGDTLTFSRADLGGPVAPDRTLTYERDETGRIVRSDHLARRLTENEELAEIARRADDQRRRKEEEREAAELARLEQARAEQAEREAAEQRRLELEAEAERQRLEQEAEQLRQQQEEERRLAEEARKAAQARAEAQKRKQEEERRRRDEAALAEQRRAEALRQQEQEKAQQREARRRAEEQAARQREQQDARDTFEQERRRKSAEQEGIRVAQEHGSEFEREMAARREKHARRQSEKDKNKRAVEQEIARLEAEQKTRRAREAKIEQAWAAHAAKGQGQNNPRVDGGRVSGTVSGGHAQPANTKDSQSEVSLVSDDSGAPLGRGLDVGTANLVAARMDAEGGIEFFPARNAFLDVPEDPYTLKMLKSQGVPYIKRENKLYVIGQDAFELANIFNREMRRPMKNGLISPTDADAMPMEVELFKKILGPPRVDGEACYYSIPADPVDSTMNIVYHTNIANGLLQRLGYKGTPFNEGLAIVFSELGDDEFTGIGISCGGGMVNVCVAFRSMNVISFSSAKGGDWIDQQAAQVMGCAASRITHIKESGVDINAPKTPEEEAIVIYYRHLIKYSLENIMKKFAITKDIPNFPKPVPIAVSGGTSMVGGFIEVFKDEFSKVSKNFPIKISDIRRAEDQFNATAKGCLLAALSNEE